MRILMIMPEIENIDLVIQGIKSQFEAATEIEVRFNFEQGTKNHHLYDAYIIYMLEGLNVSADDIIQFIDLIDDKPLIPIFNGVKGDGICHTFYKNGIYNGLYQQDAETETIGGLIIQQRTRSSSKDYYGISSLSEHQAFTTAQLNRCTEKILSSDNKEEAFEKIASTLNSEQNVVLVQAIKSKGILLSECALFNNFDQSTNIKDCETIEKSLETFTSVEKAEGKSTRSILKNKMFVVLGNSEFSSEFGFVISEQEHEVLIIDIEPLNPSVHEVLGIDGVNENVSIGGATESSFYQAYEAAATKQISYDLIKVIGKKATPNLTILSGSHHEDLTEAIHFEPLKRLIDISSDVFDVIIINAPMDFYYSLTLYCMKRYGVLNLIPFEGTAQGVKSKLVPLNFLKKHHRFDYKMISFEHTKECLNTSELKEILGENFIGKISFDSLRMSYRNDFKGTYTNKISKDNLTQYKNLLKSLGIPVKTKYRKWFGRLD